MNMFSSIISFTISQINIFANKIIIIVNKINTKHILALFDIFLIDLTRLFNCVLILIILFIVC